MAEPFLAEMRIMAFNFPPKGWAECNGQFLPINQNQALFSLLGTTYGGDGRTTFALPDLRGRTPIHEGAGFTRGGAGGKEFHTISQSEMPTHNHSLQSSTTDANTPTINPAVAPTGGRLLARNLGNMYVSNVGASGLAMQAGTITNTGGSQAHENRQPFLVLNFCVALQGIFPSPN
ncbi:MAG TPA: tail fiber protein [Candidatus Saccharimonadia bacterium]|nr:tail fiber protein [Candidatus Saccharimonadia bacterium]